eukprot:CAMPEP_0167789814 /NCGR_PEP_ID=MMETSP0111_2-20121227/10917_1 /TAXON_ID=91324 /ORGANISM="Lotharella globosa, Strain CCCM811" /LENGTH=132 /DNA_ID=CAMNT_0007682069 /DNA_START=471 /DNA_END=869 /DNA_ORIENTATION=+
MTSIVSEPFHAVAAAAAAAPAAAALLAAAKAAVADAAVRRFSDSAGFLPLPPLPPPPLHHSSCSPAHLAAVSAGVPDSGPYDLHPAPPSPPPLIANRPLFPRRTLRRRARPCTSVRVPAGFASGCSSHPTRT